MKHPVSAGNIALGTSFAGTSGPGYKDHPDAAGAVGPDTIVDFTGAAFVVRNKTTGQPIEQMSQTQFWTRAGTTPTTINDPRIIFDPLTSRWFAVESAPYDALAVSADANPTHAWKAVTLTTSLAGDLLERIGVDANGVYICSYGRTGQAEAVCFAIPKPDLLWSDTGAPSLAHLATFPALPFETFPATDLNPTKDATAPEVFLTRQGGQNETNIPLVILMEKLTWSGTTARMGATQRIGTTLSYSTPGIAGQPGSGSPGIKAREDHRILDLVESDGGIYGAVGTEINHRVGADWFEIRVSDGAIVQQSTIADATRDVLFPTVAADTRGNIAFGFTGTSATEYPSVYVAARTPTDPPGTLGAPVLAAAGTAPYICYSLWGSTGLGNLLKAGSTNPIGWGTYSTTVTDPANPTVLWTFQQYGDSPHNCQWTTRWTSFTINK